MTFFRFCTKKHEKHARNIENIKVLGTGCKTCHQQYANVKKAVCNLRLSVTVEYINDIEKIVDYGVMGMPAIIIDGKVAASGKLLSQKEVEMLLRG